MKLSETRVRLDIVLLTWVVVASLAVYLYLTYAPNASVRAYQTCMMEVEVLGDALRYSLMR